MSLSRLLTAAMVGLVVVLAGCSGADRVEEPTSEAAEPEAPGAAVDDADTDAAEAREHDPDLEDAGGDAGPGSPGFAGEPEAGEGLPEPVAARSGERVIKDGTMTIEVDAGQFQAGFRRVIDTARDLGGHLTDSTSTAGPDGGTSGSVTVRVPVERYEELLTRVGRVGTLRSQDISSRDVTAEFTDLESRLRHLRAQEAFYLELLEEAGTVQDAIAVKQQLDSIQSQVEQAQGRLHVLEDRTAYSTLTVEIVEPGAEPVVATSDARPMLADYWRTARDGFVTVVGWLLVTAVSLSPVLVPLLLAAIAWRLTRRRLGVPATVAPDGD